MKKLMLVAMVAFAAIAANAAKITWGVNTGTTLADITSGSMYLVWSDTAIDFGGVKAQSFDSSTITGLGGVIIDTQTYAAATPNATTVVKPGTYGSKNMSAGPHKFYSVVIADDGKTMQYSAQATTPILNNENSASISAAGNTFGSVAAQDVPEPTSGLLLLLGMAGLALRRRRA